MEADEETKEMLMKIFDIIGALSFAFRATMGVVAEDRPDIRERALAKLETLAARRPDMAANPRGALIVSNARKLIEDLTEFSN